MPDRISPADVAHVARLARLDITDDERELFAGQLGAVLEHANDIANLDIAGVPATAHPLPIANVFREDEPHESLDRDEVLAMAPDVEDGQFKVPRILGEAP
jgi:aspartyl-tRNA(Asn)/glutamyl-tRNA(Gln) amidotransferase subunit C